MVGVQRSLLAVLCLFYMVLGPPCWSNAELHPAPSSLQTMAKGGGASGWMLLWGLLQWLPKHHASSTLIGHAFETHIMVNMECINETEKSQQKQTLKKVVGIRSG